MQDKSKRRTRDGWESINLHSKSFSWATKLFNRKQGSEIAILYFLCRGLDDIADKQSEGKKQKLLNFYEMVQNRDYSLDASLTKFIEIYNYLDLDRTIVLQFVEGLIEDQEEVAVLDEEELLNYCYKVAGTVGTLMCPLLGCKNTNAYRFAVDLGIGMQLTNIARDVMEDSLLDRRYLPGQWLNHLTAKKIRVASKKPESNDYKMIQSAIGKTLDLANQYYASGRQGFYYLPFRSKVAISAATTIYQNIGDKRRKRKFNWEQPRVFTSSTNKFFSTLPSLISGIKKSEVEPTHKNILHQHLPQCSNY